MSKRLKTSSIRRLLLGVAILALGVCVAAALWVAHFLYAPLRFAPEPRDFDIAVGTTLRGVSQQLQSAGILADAWRFELLARFQEKAGAIKAGSYQIDPQWTAPQLLQAITGAATRLDKVVGDIAALKEDLKVLEARFAKVSGYR